MGSIKLRVAVALATLAGIMGYVGGYYVGGRSGIDVDTAVAVERDTVSFIDTIRIECPRPAKDAVVIRDTVYITPDLDTVAVPMVSREYSDSLYSAWVSGPIDPRLDSIRIHMPRTTIRETVTMTQQRSSRWHIGISAGAAYTPAGVQPYVGIGLCFSLYDFKFK